MDTEECDKAEIWRGKPYGIYIHTEADMLYIMVSLVIGVTSRGVVSSTRMQGCEAHNG